MVKSTLRRVHCALSFFLFIDLSGQQDSISQSSFERDFQFDIFKAYFKPAPSLLHLSNIIKFTYGDARYQYGEGDFKAPQDFKKLNGITLETASLEPLKNTSWTLYGNMSYLNTRNEDVETNLSYDIYSYNSPYYFFQKKSGLWNLENYDLAVIGNNKLSDKVSVGGQFRYNTNFYYRKTDTRNKKQSLVVDGKLSAAYSIKPKQFISLTLGSEIYKSESNLSNRYLENKSTDEYQIYFNTGLGSYLKTIQGGAVTKKYVNSIQFQWFYKDYNRLLSASSSTKFGEEKWIDEAIYRKDVNNIIGCYSIFQENIEFLYNEKKLNKDMFTSLSAQYLSGKGKIWESNRKVYNPNFKTSQIDVKGKFQVIFHDKYLNSGAIAVSYIKNQRRDYNYGYRLDDSFFNFNINLGVKKLISEKTEIFMKPSISFRPVLNVDHRPYAAKNLYVDWIGNPWANYLGTSSYILSNNLGVNLKAGNSLVIFDTDLEYWKPVDKSKEIKNAKYKKNLYLTFGSKIFF